MGLQLVGGSCDRIVLEGVGHGAGEAERAGTVFEGRNLALDALPPPFRSFTVFLGQALMWEYPSLVKR